MEGRKKKKEKISALQIWSLGEEGRCLDMSQHQKKGTLLLGQKAVLLIPQREFLAPPEFQGTGQGKAAVKIRAALSKETLHHASAHLLGK